MTNVGFDPFDASAQKSLHWIDDVNEIMGRDDRTEAYQSLRAVLHALRDRLTVEEGADLSAQLPMILRGVYYDGWKPSKQPVKLRDVDEFLDYVREKLGPVSNIIPPDEAVNAVFSVLDKRITEGEIEDVRKLLPEEFGQLWPA